MKIITWNMNYWQQKTNRTEAWNFLINQNVDIALLQETKPIQDLDSITNYNLFFNPALVRDKWGSAILIKKQYPIIQKYNFPSLYAGSETLMVFDVATGNDCITIINIYGKHDSEKYCSTTMHHIISDITPFLHKNKRKNILLAGDFNVARAWDNNHYDPLHSIVFDRLEDKNLGLINITQEQFRSDIQTHFDTRYPNNQYQLDYMYATKTLYQKLSSCKVYPKTGLSDHCPIEVEFNI